MSLLKVAAITAIGRAALGAALIAAPSAVGAKWIASAAEDERAGVVIRGVGARDVVLGLGAVRAISEDRDVVPWLLAAALSDVTDFVAVLAARERLPQSNVTGTLAAAGGSAAIGIAAVLAYD